MKDEEEAVNERMTGKRKGFSRVQRPPHLTKAPEHSSA